MEIERRTLLGGAAAMLAAAGAGAARAAAATDVATPSTEEGLTMVNLEELEARAAKVLAPGPFAFLSGGGAGEVTLRRNRTALQDVIIEPHYLNSTPPPDLSTTILGSKLTAPLIVAPVGGQGVFHMTGDVGTAAGGSAAGWLMTASGASSATLEQIAEAASGPKWFQLYMSPDRGIAGEVLTHAKAAGYTAIVFSIDALGAGNSEALQRTGFPIGSALGQAQQRFAAQAKVPPARRGGNKLNLGWDDVEFIQKTTGLPVILKGVLTPELARQGVARGVGGIWVSNHGGRQLDTVRASIDALPPIADVVGGKVPIVIDSGFRRGTDVLKALAYGANAVAVGRPLMYGLALGGGQGVRSVCERLATELKTAMQFAGAGKISELNRSYVAKG